VEESSPNRWQQRLNQNTQLAASKMLINDWGWKGGNSVKKKALSNEET